MSSTKIALVFSVLVGLYLLSLFTAGYTSPISLNRQVLRVRPSGAGLDVHYFYGSGCPHCTRVEPFLAEMEQKYPLVIHRYDVYSNRSLFSVFDEYSQRYGLPEGSRGVPTVFVGNTYFMGDDPILKNLEQTVKEELEKGNAASQIASSNAAGMLDTVEKANESGNSKSAGLDSLPLLTITVAALVDSINPCAIAILLFLLAGLLVFRKREKALRVGLAFTLSVFIANILFGFGIIAAINVASFSSVFQAASGSIALLTGVLLVKDSFIPGGGGFVMEVPRSLRPYLKRKLSTAFFGRKASVLAVFLVGFLVTSFEIPCTGGPYFYVLARVADEATRMQSIPTLLYYNVVFVLPLVLITVLLYLGSVHLEKAVEWKDRNKRLLGLARGLPMMTIGLVTLPTETVINALIAASNVYRSVFVPTAMILVLLLVYRCFQKGENRSRFRKWAIFGTLTVTIALAPTSTVRVNLSNGNLAQTGFLGRVVYNNDDCPRSHAYVRVYHPVTGFKGLCGTTNGSGYCQKGDMILLPDTLYKANATYPDGVTLFAYTNFITDSNGYGVATMRRNSGYPNGTESCGDSECDGYRYCFSGDPNYVECRHNDTNTTPILNQDCDTKKCCSCSAQYYYGDPAANYNETHNSDCPSCEVCSALDTCSYALNGTDPKEDCPGNDFCSGSGNCTTIPPAITVLSPQNQTYYSNSTPLTFMIDEPTSWIGYSLDSQSNITTTGNTIVSVDDGTHRIVAYANDTFGNMGSSQTICFTVNSSLYEPWETSFIGLGGYPIVGFTSYDGKLYAASNNNLYIYDGIGWNVLETPAYVTSLMSYENNLIIGGQGGLYSYDGSSFSLLFPVSTYIKVLGVYNNTLYAGTFLDKPPALYYCNGPPENPANWHVDTGFSTILNFSGAFGSIDSFAVYDGNMYVASGNTVYRFDGASWSVALSYEYAYTFLDMQVYNGKLYLATRDLNRIPLYMGGTGFSGVIIEFDGENWTTALGHDYWIYSLEEYNGKLYAGTANRIYTFNGTAWDVSFYSAEGAYYVISMINYDGKIYAGMGNGYIFADPAPPRISLEAAFVPEFS